MNFVKKKKLTVRFNVKTYFLDFTNIIVPLKKRIFLHIHNLVCSRLTINIKNIYNLPLEVN